MKNLIQWTLLVSFLVSTITATLFMTEYILRLRYPSKIPMFLSNSNAISSFKVDIDNPHYGKYKIPLQTNSYGYRSNRDTNPGNADIILLGDSNIAALFLPFEQTLGVKLEDMLGGNIMVANMGVPGDGPDQALKRFSAIAGTAKARGLVFHIFSDNDYGDLFRNNIFTQTGYQVFTERSNLDMDPMFNVNKSLLLRATNKVMVASGLPITLYDLISEDNYYSPYHRGLDAPVSSSNAALLEEWRQISEKEYENYVAGKYTSWAGDHYDYAIATSPSGKIAATATGMLTYIFNQSKMLYNGPKECFIVLIQPSENDLVDYGPAFAHEMLASNYPEYYPRALTDIAVEAANRADVHYINLFDSFSANPALYYFSEDEKPGDNHWNSAGISKAAELLAEYFREFQCLPETGEALQSLTAMESEAKADSPR